MANQAKITNPQDTSPEAATKHICLIQLTRIGDILQTVQAVQATKQNHPDIKLSIIVRKNFGAPLKFLLDEFFDSVIEFDSEKILDTQYENIIKNINEFVERSELDGINALINLSYCNTSKYLTSLIKSQHKLGVFKDNFNKDVIVDKWSQYLYANVLSGNNNVFSLVDLFRAVVGATPCHSNAVTDQKQNNIIIHPFASDDKKVWKAQKWIEVIYKLVKETKNTIYIVGSKNELDESKKITSSPLIKPFLSRVKSVVGVYSIKEVFNLLSDAKLFIGHDSMVSHLAAINATPSLTISLGPVRHLETSPYNKNSVVIVPKTTCYPCHATHKCDNQYKCHADISYQSVLEVSAKMLQGQLDFKLKDLIKDSSEFYFSNIDIFKASFSNTGKHKLTNISSLAHNTDEVLNSFFRIAWQFNFEQVEENQPIPRVDDQAKISLKNIADGLKHIYELSEFAKKYTQYILEEVSKESPNIVLIKNYSKRIDEVDELFSVVKKTQPKLTPIINYSSVSKANLFGSNIVQISESAFLSYNEISNISRIMYELLEQTLIKNDISLGSERKSNA